MLIDYNNTHMISEVLQPLTVFTFSVPHFYQGLNLKQKHHVQFSVS